MAAPSGKKDDIGFVFDSCRFIGDNVPDSSVYLMRPWRPEGKSLFTGCSNGSHINAAGFSAWKGREDEAGLAGFFCDDARWGREHLMSREECTAIADSLRSKFETSKK